MIDWHLDRVDETGSTNADVRARAARGAPEGIALVADHQTAGRGRLDRRWTAPPGTALAVSVLLRPDGHGVPRAAWTWLPLLAGCAVVDAVRATTDLTARLKWPNDVLLDERKLCGILTEVVDGAVVVGMGINVSATPDQLPVPTAVSLRTALLARARSDLPDSGALVSALLDALDAWYARWTAAHGDPDTSGLRPGYRERCTTLGRTVRIEVEPPEHTVEGTARDVDELGRLVVETAAGSRVFGAGDIVHVR